MNKVEMQSIIVDEANKRGVDFIGEKELGNICLIILMFMEIY